MSVKMKLFCGFLALGVVISAQNAGAAQDGSIFSGETCTNCKAAQTAKKVAIVDGTRTVVAKVAQLQNLKQKIMLLPHRAINKNSVPAAIWLLLL